MNTTITSHVYYVETTWKRPFPRRFNVEYTWCVSIGLDFQAGMINQANNSYCCKKYKLAFTSDGEF